MAFKQRTAVDYFFATLASPVSLSDTTMTAADSAFAPLTDLLSSNQYLPMILHDPATKHYEVVWVTGHATGASSVTMARGKEGTTNQFWNAGTQVTVAPTVRDVQNLRTLATFPSEPFTGQRILISDLGADGTPMVYQNGSWVASAGLGIANNMHPNMHAVSAPDGAVLQMRAGQTGGTTSPTGLVRATYRTPFPNGTLVCMAMSTSFLTEGKFVTAATTAAYADIYSMAGSAGSRLASTSVTFHYLAIGW